MRCFFLLLATVLASACAPQAPVGAATLPVPTNSAATCAGYCQSLGLELDSVVIMANNVGCVCRAHPAAPAPAPAVSGGAAAGGLVAFMIQQEASQQTTRNVQQTQQQQQIHQQIQIQQQHHY